MAKYRVRRNGWDVLGLSYRFSALWKGIIFIKDLIAANVRYKVGSREDVFFWLDVWEGDRPFAEEFPSLFRCTSNQLAKVKDNMERNNDHTVWTAIFRRHLREDERELLLLLGALNQVFIPEGGEDRKVWAPSKEGHKSYPNF